MPEEIPAAAPKAPAKPSATPRASAAEKATGSYQNPNGSATDCNAGPAKPDGTVDLFRPGEKDAFCTDCPVSTTPLEGHYTPA